MASSRQETSDMARLNSRPVDEAAEAFLAECREDSDDEDIESSNNAEDPSNSENEKASTTDTTTNALCAFINDDSKVPSEERIQYTMMLAEDVVDEFSLDKEPYCNITKKTTVKPKRNHYMQELRRRHPSITGIKNKSVPQLRELMKEKHPLLNQDEIEWVRQEEKRVREIFERQHNEQNKLKEHAKGTGAARKMDRLRLIHSLVSDTCRPLYLQINDLPNRQELDARNSDVREPDFFDVVTEVFNDESIVYKSCVLPDLHEDFAQQFDITLSDFRLSRDKAAEMIAQQRVKIVRICSNWEQSGNGEGQREMDDQDWGHYDSNTLDGKAQKHFLQAGDTTDLLYWWHILDEEKLLNFTANVFPQVVAASSDSNATIEPLRKKAKQEDVRVRQEMNEHIGKVGKGVHTFSLVSLSRQINELKKEAYELDLKLDDYAEGSARYKKTKERIDDYENEIASLKAEYEKMKSD